jgi:hypothetical protein
MMICCTSKFQKKGLVEDLSLLTSDYDMFFSVGCSYSKFSSYHENYYYSHGKM